MIRISDAEFVTTATHRGQYPREKLPEVAFVGRSNVGKSSMINTLVGRRKLVRVSNTPGRTRTLNFFDVKVDSRGRTRRVRLCDLPGYGYAKASKVERDEWQGMIEEYLTEREQLMVVVTIIDVDVGPTPDDMQMIDFLQQTEARILVVATRLDRVAKAKRKPRLDQLGKLLELPHGAIVGFSSVDRLGFEEVWGRLLDITG